MPSLSFQVFFEEKIISVVLCWTYILKIIKQNLYKQRWSTSEHHPNVWLGQEINEGFYVVVVKSLKLWMWKKIYDKIQNLGTAAT